MATYVFIIVMIGDDVLHYIYTMQESYSHIGLSVLAHGTFAG